MTLALELPPELQQRLVSAAREQAVPLEQLAIRILDEHVQPRLQRAEMAALLQTWIDEAQSASDDGEPLLQAIDADRLSDRKLYPPELRGITW